MSAPPGGGGRVGCAHRGVGPGVPEEGRHVREVARSAHVHVNAVRFRLRRFTELTGAAWMLRTPWWNSAGPWRHARLWTLPRGPAPTAFPQATGGLRQGEPAAGPGR
ncbi:helix-turn-helix domain-containing protein [Streptomyces sp. CG1]|uniref:helix-turn-helix domain-containing protein n=1 Tax=Streptomyces sp. CG1 TaxID=1287523 RepID=UPI0034E253B5